MFRIGEFAVLSSISIHMLRNYDKIGLLSPEYTDTWTGYRYYSEAQIIKANRIQSLKAMGLGLKEIKEMLTNNSFGDSYRELLQKKIKEKTDDIQKRKEEIVQLELSLEKANQNENYICDIAVKSFPDRNVVCYREKISKFSDEGRLWKHLVEVCNENDIKVIPHGFSAAIQHERNQEKHYCDIEVVFEVDKVGKPVKDITYKQMPACEVASIAFRGQYYEIGNINYHLAMWIIRNDYEISQSPFCIYYVSPGNNAKVEDYLTEICFPIKKKNKY